MNANKKRPYSEFMPSTAEAAPADAGKTAVRILRFDAEVASADATKKRRTDFP
jgi:hypothetical protein